MENSVIKREDNFDEVINNILALAGAEVGYLAETTGPQTYDNGLTLATNALYQERGTRHIPPRPFMEKGVDTILLAQNSRSLSGPVLAAICGRITPGAANARVGIALQGEIRNAIRGGEFLSLKPETVRRKGSTKPLVDTGRLLQGVDTRPKR